MAEDRQLVERLRQGDRDALRRIYEKYKDELLTIASCMLADRADAEDCLHNLFVSLRAESARVRPDGNLKGYLITAMANRSRDCLRRRGRCEQASEAASRTKNSYRNYLRRAAFSHQRSAISHWRSAGGLFASVGCQLAGLG